MERLLIADDVSVDRRILVALLGEEYEIVETKNGREVIEQLEKDPTGFDCLLLDIKMPEVDGFGVLEYMGKNHLLSKVPVIALTALTEAEDHIRCYTAGVSDLLEKPYNQKVLKYKIQYVIERFRKQAEQSSPQEQVSAHLLNQMHVPQEKLDVILADARKLYAESAEKLRALKEPRARVSSATLACSR